MKIRHFYRTPALAGSRERELLAFARKNLSASVRAVESEYCFNIETSSPLNAGEIETLRWLLRETFEPDRLSGKSFLARNRVLEVGPRMNFTTAWSTNAVSVCHACGLTKVRRIERSRRVRAIGAGPARPDRAERFLSELHDRMTECPYPNPLSTFATGIRPRPVTVVPLVEEGIPALQRINAELGLGLDAWDIEYYHDLFVRDLKRNPTDVECFDLSQSNSEHSRHWFFRGKLEIDGKRIPETLMKIVKDPLKAHPGNSVIAFRDNSSAIRGYRIRTILPVEPGRLSRFREARPTYHLIFTAETHNFPSGVAPFPGAETGTGGRIRDVQATGRGGLVVAGTAAYCVGNLRIPGYRLPWEDRSFVYPDNLASPLAIEIEASNGASDYGNKFGEPVIQGFTRSFGMRMPDGERREWIKPIMFTGGIGQVDARQTEKGPPEPGMLVTKIGGPAYRIGMGGGAASSMIQGENVAELDFNAVQRGDAEMEQKVNRVLRACVEMGDANPIVSIQRTPSSASMTRGPGETATSSRRSSTRPGPGSRCGRSRAGTTPSRCSNCGAPSTRSRTPCCSGPNTHRASNRSARGRRSPSPISVESPATGGSSCTMNGTGPSRSISTSKRCWGTCRRRSSGSTGSLPRSRRCGSHGT